MTWLFTLLVCHMVAELFFLHLHELLIFFAMVVDQNGNIYRVKYEKMWPVHMIVSGNHGLRGVTHTIWFVQDILDFNP